MGNNDSAPMPPQFAAHGMEADFTAMPPGAPFPVLLQARVLLQAIDLSRPGQTHTKWFALTPTMARQMAEDLRAAADQAEKPHLPAPGKSVQ